MSITIPDIPKKVYKFMDPYYLEKLKKDQKFYINHLNNYKESELGSEVGDDREGTLTSEVYIDNYVLGSNKNPAFEKSFHSVQSGVMIDGLVNMRMSFHDTTIGKNIIDQNYFVYCVGLEYDEKVKKEFGGATLIIENFPQFLKRLNRELSKQGKRFVVAEECKYIKNRKNLFTEKDSSFNVDFPALVKDQRYAYQKEFRILWENIDGSEITEPLNIYCPEALRYCSFEF